MRCVLVGNYGVGNVGDEALREYFLYTFPEIEWIVLSAHPHKPNEYPRLPGGIRSFFGFKWLKTISQMRDADAVVFGGGSLFTDVESVYACILWWVHAFVARICGKPIILASQGMGPYQTALGRGLARWVARRSAYISVRDEASMKRAQEWDLNTKIVQTFDPVFAFMKGKKLMRNTKNVFTIIPRHNSGEILIQEAVELLKKTSDIQSVHILLMQPNDVQERAVARRIHESLSVTSEIVSALSVNDLLSEMSQSSIVVTQRFHGALAALATDVPVTIIAQGVGDKLSTLIPYASGSKSTDGMLHAIKDGEESLRNCLLALRSEKPAV